MSVAVHGTGKGSKLLERIPPENLEVIFEGGGETVKIVGEHFKVIILESPSIEWTN